MATPPFSYPWYAAMAGDDLEQGDILESCPVFLPPSDLASHVRSEAIFRWETRDLILMSQSCDLVRGREKITDVLFCAVWKRSEINLALDQLEQVRKGGVPTLHILAECSLNSLQREVSVVDFRCVHSLPVQFVRERCVSTGRRLRLLPPYREHLSQAFARFFMRVGLPVDIPPFRKPREVN